MSQAIFPACFFPPIPWYAAAMRHSHIVLDGEAPYRKQQLNSRSYIKVSNRVLPLTLPIEKRDHHDPIIEKRVSYAEKWPHQHWMSLISAYTHSPYFEYYRDELQQLYQSRPASLPDWLLKSTQWGLSCIGWTGTLQWSRQVQNEKLIAAKDYRNEFDAKRKKLPSWFIPEPYPQVFGGFSAGLGVMDLIFNLGPEARGYLARNVKQGALD